MYSIVLMAALATTPSTADDGLDMIRRLEQLVVKPRHGHGGHGVVIGVVNLMWGVGAVIGPVAGSRITHWEGARTSYVLLSLLCLATALIFVRVDRAPASPQ